MKRFYMLSIIAVHATLSAGPVNDAHQQLQVFNKTIQDQGQLIRDTLSTIITSLNDQNSSFVAKKIALNEQAARITQARQMITQAHDKILNNKLVPKDVKTPLLEMFAYQQELLDQLQKMVMLGKKTMDDLSVRIPPVNQSIQVVIGEVGTYQQAIGKFFHIASSALKPLVDLEEAPKTIEQEVIKPIEQKVIEPLKEGVKEAAGEVKKGFEDFGRLLGI